MSLSSLFHSFKLSLATNNTEFFLHAFIIVWAFMIAFISLFIHNKWILAGIIAYEVLP